VDFSKEITVRGTVTSYNWGNPHVMFGMDVTGASGAVEKWNVGGPSTNRMAANGRKASLKPGDVITAMGYQFTNVRRFFACRRSSLANGKEMFLYGRSAFPSLFFTLSSERRYSYLRALSLIRA